MIKRQTITNVNSIIILFARIGAAIEERSQPFITETAAYKLILIQLAVIVPVQHSEHGGRFLISGVLHGSSCTFCYLFSAVSHLGKSFHLVQVSYNVHHFFAVYSGPRNQ